MSVPDAAGHSRKTSTACLLLTYSLAHVLARQPAKLRREAPIHHGGMACNRKKQQWYAPGVGSAGGRACSRRASRIAGQKL